MVFGNVQGKMPHQHPFLLIPLSSRQQSNDKCTRNGLLYYYYFVLSMNNKIGLLTNKVIKYNLY